MVDAALARLGVPWVPVPGNHDWYDGGVTWSRRYGPDNYSFDAANIHFIVWNMAMDSVAIRTYLGAELARVPPAMTIVALTHAPPSEPVIRALCDLGVNYVLTGHTHSNRVVDHGDVIELGTEPFLMGGLDFTPAGYRVVTIAGGKLTSQHRTTVDGPWLSLVAPSRTQCMDAPTLSGHAAPHPGAGANARARRHLLVAAELDAGNPVVTALIDRTMLLMFHYVGGHDWYAELPPLSAGTHEAIISARSASGSHAQIRRSVTVCTRAPSPAPGADWPQVGGSATHHSATSRAIAPPLVTRWSTALGGHVLTASPMIANGTVYVTVTDLGDGRTGGIVALDLATGVVAWRATTEVQVRGGVAVVGDTVVAPRIDGVVLGLDAATGARRWRHELAPHTEPGAAATFASVAAIGNEVFIGHQRTLAAMDAATGQVRWHLDPVPDGTNSQSLAAVAIGPDIVVGTFNRVLGGVLAWDRATSAPLWQREADETVGINATPVIGDGLVYVVNSADAVSALDLATGAIVWTRPLDVRGFSWGNAAVGTPALARGILVVPTLYRDVVALDAKTGRELWRHEALPGVLRTTHYRGAHPAGYAAGPVITGGIVWAADTSGDLAALDLTTGAPLWRAAVGAPVLAGLAASGDWLVVASYDGSVRALTPTKDAAGASDQGLAGASPSGSCTVGQPIGPFIVVVVALRRRRRQR